MHAINLRKLSRGAKGDVKRMVRAAAGDGWTVTMTGSNHICLSHPDAARPVYAPLTPQGQSAHKRLRSDMRRALKQSA